MPSKYLLLGPVIALLAACSGLDEQPNAEMTEALSASMQLLDDEQFQINDPEQALSLEHFLELPADIRQHLDETVLPLDGEEARYRTLRNWAFEEFQGDYDYDPTFTSSLDDLETSRRINCFSFSNMFVAAARYAGVPAHFQLVHSPPQWDINDKTWVVSQHINVTGSVQRTLSAGERQYLKQQDSSTGSRVRRSASIDLNRSYVVDLNPEIAADSYRSTIISDGEALSLFYSNRSVEALLSGEADTARQLGKLAILADDSSSVAWNNLGVLLSRGGKPEQAREAYSTALTLDPNNESSANNLERIYRRLGEVEEADAMAKRIQANRMKNPYYHYSMGENMLARGELQDAVGYFKDAIKRKNDERLFYYALAETQIKLADYKQATKSLKAAKKHSTNKDKQRYLQLHSQLESMAQKS
jgi:tetratricopeptide (TPR) repeat protein